MRARRVDQNSTDLYQAARKMGFKVYVRNDALGDADVQLAGLHEVWEFKNGAKARFTDLQARMRQAGWRIRTVRTVDDVIAARSEMTRAAAAISKERMGGD